MSIFSSISSGLKSVAKGVYNTVNTIGSTLAGGFSKIGNQAASVYNAVTPSGGNQSTYNSSTYKPPIQPTGISGTGTTYYNGYVPSTGSYIPSNASQGGAGFGSYGPQLPVTITAGKVGMGSTFYGGGGSNNSQTDIPYGPTQISPTRTITNDSSQMAANRAKLVADSGGKLKEVDGKVVPVGTFGANSVLTSDTFSGGSTPLVLGSTPTSTNPKINTSGLAGTLSGYKKYNATTGQYEDIPDEQVIQERKDLYDRFVGKAESVYDDSEVQAARKQRQDIKQRLRGPTDELNAIVAQQNRDLLQLRQTGSQEGVTEAVYGGQSNAINYNAAIRALPLQASIASLQGDLELAQDYIKDLVQVKSEQIKNQREYNIGLYNAIAPALDKNEQRIYDAGLKEIERQTKKEDDLVKFQAAISQKVMQNAPESVRTNVNNRLWAANSIQEVIEAAGKYGVDPNTEIRQLDNGNTVVIDKNTNRIISDLGGAKPTVVGTGNYTTAQEKVIDNINTSVSNSFNYKAVNSAKGFADGVIVSLNQKNGLSDIAAINQFQKVIDEGAVTREQDVILVRGAQSLVNTLKTKIKKLEKGDQLGDKQRAEMATTVQALYEAKLRSLNDDPYVKSQIDKAKRSGIDVTDTILGNLGSFSNSQSNPTKQTVKVDGKEYVVGQVYNDGTANWVVDANGKWSKQ